MRSKEQINEIVRRLEEAYPLAECALEYEKDYELLFAVRLLSSVVASDMLRLSLWRDSSQYIASVPCAAT